MELNKIPTLVVGLVVAILIVTVVAIPIFDDASKSIYSEYNNPEGTYSISTTNSGPVEITGDGTNIYVNGVKQIKSVKYGSYKIWGQDFCVYINTDSGSNVFDGTYNGGLHKPVTSMKYENGVITLISGVSGAEVKLNSSFFIYPDDNGDYAQYSNTTDVHINNDAIVYIGSNGPNYTLFKMTSSGNEQIGGVINATTGSTAKLNASIVPSDDGLSYQFASTPSLTYTNSEGETSSGNWVSIYCPIKYNAVSEMDGAIRTIIDVLPVILIVSMLVAIVATVFVKIR